MVNRGPPAGPVFTHNRVTTKGQLAKATLAITIGSDIRTTRWCEYHRLLADDIRTTGGGATTPPGDANII